MCGKRLKEWDREKWGRKGGTDGVHFRCQKVSEIFGRRDKIEITGGELWRRLLGVENS